MKKVLSLMLSLALIISTLALPIAVSAGVGDKADGSITVSYSAMKGGAAVTSDNPVRPGDEFTVDVNLTGSKEITADYVSLFIKYDNSTFEFDKNNSSAAQDSKLQINNDNRGYISIANAGAEEPSIALSESAVTIATLKFKVMDNALNVSGTADFGIGTNNGMAESSIADHDFGSYDNSETANLLENKLTVNVAANTVKALIDNEEITSDTTKTYYTTDGVTVKYDGTNVEEATVTKEGGTAQNIDAANGTKVTEAGTYIISLKAKGMTEAKTYTFIIVAEAISAKLDTSVTNKIETGYKPSDTFSVPVKISGLSTAKAAMVKFDLTYDTAFVSLTSATNDANISVTQGTETAVDGSETQKKRAITVGATGTETEIANDATVVTLTFTVNSGISKYDNTSVSIANQAMALVTVDIDPTDTKLGITTASQTVTVVPADGKFATVNDSEIKVDWTNTDYDVTVTPVSGATVVYALKDTSFSLDEVPAQNDLKALYEAGASLTESKFPVNQDKQNIYIVAKIGDVYSLVAKYTPEDLKIDKTEPSKIEVENENVDKWTKTDFVLTEDQVKVTDAHANTKKKASEYKIGSASEFTAFTGEKMTISEDGTHNVTIKAYDAAGNSNTTTITVKVDKTAPVLNVGDVTVNTDGTRTVNLTATDATSGIKTVVAYKVDSSTAEPAEDAQEITVTKTPVEEGSADTGAYTFIIPASENGTLHYYIKATDNAGNETVTRKTVVIDRITGASKMSVKVVKDAESYSDAFMTSTKITEDYAKMNELYKGSNGKFTYVAISVDKPSDGYTNTIKVDNAEVTIPESGVYTMEFSAADLTETVTEKEHTIEITTANNTDKTDKATDTYKFTIVSPDDMPSVDNNKIFNIIDYALIKRVLNGKTETNILPGDDDNFKGGIFSGDVDGDLNLTTKDYEAILTSIIKCELKGEYTFPVLNKTVQSQGE